MALPDLTGQNIENTYQRIVQTDGTNFYDGTGSVVNFGVDPFPYTGSAAITGSLILTGSAYISGGLATQYIDFNTTSINTGIPARLKWNDGDGTLDLGLKGGNVILQIGQESVIRVINKTGGNLLESQYKVVRIRSINEGGAQGQRLAIVLSQANNDANSVDTLGLVTENIDVNQEGFITTSGLVRNINTTGDLQGENWEDGDALYLSPTTPGALTKIKPQGPDHTVVMGYVVYAHQNQGKIFVKVDNGYEIDELHNVNINTASLSIGDLLIRSGSEVWTNSKQLTGSYGLTGSLTATSLTSSLFGTSSWAVNALTASHAPSYVLTSTTSSMSVLSSSFALTASYLNEPQVLPGNSLYLFYNY